MNKDWIECETCGCKYRLSTIAGKAIDENAECPGKHPRNQKLTVIKNPREIHNLWGARWLEHHPGELD